LQIAKRDDAHRSGESCCGALGGTVSEEVRSSTLVPHRTINVEEHYNDFDSSQYKIRGTDEHLLFGFSTVGFADVMANGGPEMLVEKYPAYSGPTLPKIEGCDLTLAVDRKTIPKKLSIVNLIQFMLETPKGATPEEKESIRAKNKALEEVCGHSDIAANEANRQDHLQRYRRLQKELLGCPHRTRPPHLGR
jgi:hypothetical protein